MKKLVIVFLTITAFYSCDKFEFEGKGDIITKELNLDDIDRFSNEGSIDIFVEQGSSQSIIAEGESNIIDRLVTKVKDGRWDIRLQSGSYSNYSLTIKIITPNIEEMIIDGSGDVFISQYEISKLRLRSTGSGDFIVNEPLTISNRLDLDVEGSGDISIAALDCQNLSMDNEASGDITISGSTQDAVYFVDGSGHISAFDLIAATGTAVSNGSGDIRLTAMNQLDVNIDGSGDVLYKGTPNITEKNTGSGKLIDRN